MCGIVGHVHIQGAEQKTRYILEQLMHRGPDGQQIVALDDNIAFGHALLALVEKVQQPLQGKGLFVANCEIYNWKILAQQYNIQAKNDADLLFQLLEQDKLLYEELDGVFAFAYLKEGHLLLARDLWGVKPLVYEFLDEGIVFASEAKVLKHPCAVPPGYVISINMDMLEVTEYDKADEFLYHIDEHEGDIKIIEHLFWDAVTKRVPQGQKIGVLFSGGIDSTFLAFILKKLGVEFTCYATGFHEEGLKYPEDLDWAREAAEHFGFAYKFVSVDSHIVDKHLKDIMNIIESKNPVKVGVALPFYFAMEQAKKDGIRVMFSGLGSEEIFAGYDRHTKAENINAECAAGLLMMSERDLYRDDMLSMHFSMEMRLPFLDKNLVKYALGISQTQKIKDDMKKYILRMTALYMGVPQKYAMRPKRAAQYGSRFDGALAKLAKRHGYESKSKYLDFLFPQKRFND